MTARAKRQTIAQSLEPFIDPTAPRLLAVRLETAADILEVMARQCRGRDLGPQPRIHAAAARLSFALAAVVATAR